MRDWEHDSDEARSRPDWATVTDNQIKSAISAVWDHAAIVTYGE